MISAKTQFGTSPSPIPVNHDRLEEETLERSFEILEGRPVPIKSKDPRLQGQEYGVTYG